VHTVTDARLPRIEASTTHAPIFFDYGATLSATLMNRSLRHMFLVWSGGSIKRAPFSNDVSAKDN
jgi:hypothetical protein